MLYTTHDALRSDQSPSSLFGGHLLAVACASRWRRRRRRDAFAPTAASTGRSSNPFEPAEPPVKDAGWARNPIDRFILARLEKEGITPVARGRPRRRCIRRVSLDLTGLPPTPAEVDAFLADTSPDAYEKLVDRLLASPHYGERWGRHWLDVARYADSNGYSHRRARARSGSTATGSSTPLNRDLPFDQFSIEQLAGDLLPERDARAEGRDRLPPQHADQRGGRHRPGAVPRRGGRRPRRHDRHRAARADGRLCPVPRPQVRPDPQQEYYQFYAFFNNQRRADARVLPASPDCRGADQGGSTRRSRSATRRSTSAWRRGSRR